MKPAALLVLFCSFGIGATWVGNEACRPCHPSLYTDYMKTPMARSSGVVSETIPGAVRPASTGTMYRIDKAGTVRFDGSEQRLRCFIGSGAAGRSYVYSYKGH